MSQVRTYSVTNFVHFDRTGDDEWTLRTQLQTNEVKVSIEMAFTRSEDQAVWGAERLAMQKAHAAIAEWLASQPDRVEPIAPGA